MATAIDNIPLFRGKCHPVVHLSRLKGILELLSVWAELVPVQWSSLSTKWVNKQLINFKYISDGH